MNPASISGVILWELYRSCWKLNKLDYQLLLLGKAAMKIALIVIGVMILVAVVLVSAVYRKYARTSDLPRIVKLEKPVAELRIENVQVFDSLKGSVRPEQTVIIRKDKIVWVGPSGDPEIPPADPRARRIDGRGKTLLPGLIDAHIHTLGDANPFWHTSMPNQQRNMDSYLYAGVTSVWDQGGMIRRNAALRESLRSGEMEGPDFYMAAGMFTAVGGYQASILKEMMPWYLSWIFLKDYQLQADTISELEKHLKTFSLNNPDSMKIAIESMIGEPVINDTVLNRAVAEGLEMHLPVVIHVSTTENAMRAVDAGATALAHTPGDRKLTGEQISQLIEKDVYMMSTIKIGEMLGRMMTPGSVMEFTEMAQRVLDPGIIEAFHQRPDDFEMPEVWTKIANNFPKEEGAGNWNLCRYFEGGGKLVVATDAGAAPGWGHGYTLHMELEAVVAAGIPAAAALQGATIAAAQAGKIDHKTGSIEAGKQADLLLLGADPTADIRNTTRIEAVYSRGRLVKRLQ
jgi:imidazolonepropionase-like amidohydrolase